MALLAAVLPLAASAALVASPTPLKVYQLAVTVTVSDPEAPGAEIRVTLDGSEPGPSAPLLAGPIELTANTTVRAWTAGAPMASWSYFVEQALAELPRWPALSGLPATPDGVWLAPRGASLAVDPLGASWVALAASADPQPPFESRAWRPSNGPVVLDTAGAWTLYARIRRPGFDWGPVHTEDVLVQPRSAVPTIAVDGITVSIAGAGAIYYAVAAEDEDRPVAALQAAAMAGAAAGAVRAYGGPFEVPEGDGRRTVYAVAVQDGRHVSSAASRQLQVDTDPFPAWAGGVIAAAVVVLATAIGATYKRLWADPARAWYRIHEEHPPELDFLVKPAPQPSLNPREGLRELVCLRHLAEEGEMTPATVFCALCEYETLCVTCSRFLHFRPAARGHAPVPLPQ